jgi:hypothetical protein
VCVCVCVCRGKLGEGGGQVLDEIKFPDFAKFAFESTSVTARCVCGVCVCVWSQPARIWKKDKTKVHDTKIKQKH